MTLDEALARPTIGIVEAGAVFFGISRAKAYEAARSGHLPTIDVCGRKLVPVAAVAKQLGLKTRFESAA